jgi:hypothetical protein
MVVMSHQSVTKDYIKYACIINVIKYISNYVNYKNKIGTDLQSARLSSFCLIITSLIDQ